MKKLLPLTLSTLIISAVTLSSAVVLAQPSPGPNIDLEQLQSPGQDLDFEQQQSQNAQDVTRTVAGEDLDDEATQANTPFNSLGENRGFMNAAPMNGIHASSLIGINVKTVGDEDLGPVEDLIMDQHGQVVAIVVSVGGFLGIGEKDVAIGWGHVTRSGVLGDQALRIDVTREQLSSAPEFKLPD